MSLPAASPARALSAGSSIPVIRPLNLAAASSRPTKAIFGYLPYWERVDGTPNIHWNLLTHLACFSMGVNTNGTLQAMSGDGGWPGDWSSLIDTAHANGVKVILVATNMTPSSIYTLITTPAYKSTFFAAIEEQLVNGNADGLNVDFEGANDPAWRSYINGFMAELTSYLHGVNPAWEISFAGPALSSGWDLPGLAASCDYIFIMGYAFYGSWSTTTGACAPYNSIKSVVDTHYGTVSHNTPDKLILGLPYYGGHWRTATSAANSAVLTPVKTYGWVGSTRFKNDVTDSLDYGLLWDSPSKTPWYRWLDSLSVWRQVWFDNDVSLGLKFQLAQDHNYRGVGMWALNYDGARPELWDELGRRFSPDWVAAPPDRDGDSDVDQSDFGRFQLCVTGSGVNQWNHGCSWARLDRDLDVDADDMAKFIACMSDPGVAPAADCAQ